MINMGGQRPKIGSNWPLTRPYLQRRNGEPNICIYMYVCEYIYIYIYRDIDIDIIYFLYILIYVNIC